MKTLISVTAKELKRNYNRVLNMGAELAETTDQEIDIIICTAPHKYTPAIIIEPCNGGIKFNYNRELLGKYGICTYANKQQKIEAIIADAFEKSGIAEYARKNKGVTGKLQKAMILAAKDIINEK